MCDTVIVTPEAARRGRMLFAKNSDREPSEPQAVEIIDAAEHADGASVRCTYVSVPQVRRTRRVLLCRPFWMWGAEMGANDAGVVIGNEAVFTRAPQEPLALLGMDLLRLALERAGSATHAVETIGALLEEHGQGGLAGHISPIRYDNSFLLADREQAWVLETAGRAWVAKRVHGVRAISNALTLRDDWDLATDGLAAKTRDFGLSPGKGKLDFGATFGKRLINFAANASNRRGLTQTFLSQRSAEVASAMAALRLHGIPDRPNLALQGLRLSVCAHASWLPTRQHGQTTGSLISELGADGDIHFVTATAAPCTSLFKPVWLDSELPPETSGLSFRFDPSRLWWRHERLHRKALRDLSSFVEYVREKREALEKGWTIAAESGERALTRKAFEQAESLERELFESFDGGELGTPASPYRRYWRNIDERSGLLA